VQVESNRTYLLPMPPAALWEQISDVTAYQRWWPWLRSFDGSGLARGDVWCCAVRPPLRYTVRFTVTLNEVLAHRLVSAVIDGDICGRARLEIVAAARGSEVRLISALRPDTRLLRAITAVARPVARHGHDWVLDCGARQFTERATR
jgi:Polyketide cyclase / dehydrase and lipid transport